MAIVMRSTIAIRAILVVILTFFSSPLFAKTETAIFSAGCFWCAEEAFEKVPGVEKVVSGYTGGSAKNPTYKEVSAGGTGHYEAIQVYFDTDKVSYTKLLDVFWRNVDPVDPDGQFCDKGQQYKAAIFYSDADQEKLASQSKKNITRSGRFKKITTAILPAAEFYPAEEYHQDYAKKNPVHYQYYRYRCGRDQRLEQLWGSPQP